MRRGMADMKTTGWVVGVEGIKGRGSLKADIR